MILKTFQKQPSEVKDYDIDFSPWLTPMNDTLDFIGSKVECLDDPSNTTLEIDSLSITTSKAKLWMSGGTSGLEYKVTLLVSTVGGRHDESELIFVLEDI